MIRPLGAAVVALAVAGLARAQTPPPTPAARAEARAHYEKAVSHFNANEYVPAGDEFLLVYKAVPQAALLYNAAQAYRLGGEGDKALANYRAFLKAVPEAKQRPDVERRIAELEHKTVAVKDVPDMAVPPKAPKTPPPSGMSSTTTAGSDRLAGITDVIKQNRAGFRACFDKWSKAHPGVNGRVTLTFYLDPDGEIGQPTVDEKGFAAPEVAACMEDLSRTLHYPKSPSGKFTRFSYPFDFKAAR